MPCVSAYCKASSRDLMDHSRQGAMTCRSGASALKVNSNRTWSFPLPVQPCAKASAPVARALLERDNYKTRTIDFKPKAAEPGKPLAIGQTPAPAAVEVPKDCLTLVIGGPQLAYPPPIVTAIKQYVEGGGHALFMLDNVMKIGRGE